MTCKKYSFLEHLVEGVLLANQAFEIQYVNTAAIKMLKIDKMSSVLLEKGFKLLRECSEACATLKSSVVPTDDSMNYLEFVATREEDGSFVLIVQDSSNEHKVLEMGKNFVSNASHELRTPITIIKGFAETLQDLPELSREMLSDITEKIVRNCRRMENLVQNLLLLADVENVPVSHFHPTDLGSVIDNAICMVHSLYPQAAICKEREQEVLLVQADSDLLELAIRNLIDNAAKYSVSPVQISVVTRRKEERVEVEIRDSGIGISEVDLGKIFERFYTVNKAHARRLGGAGLGLSLVKIIIEKHNGTIHVASQLGKGTSIKATFPLI